jgi:prolyl-tRNA editing enzyme YbaK/EbsC (Cys-tRNA(Pro) deacylase)
VLHPNAQRVQAALISAGSQAEVRQLPDSARTSGEAAAALGVAVEQIAKSLVFLADGKPVMAVVSGADRVDTAKLAAALDGARITRADADTVRAATGYPIGGVSPAGLDGSLPVLVDGGLAELGEVWAAAGTPHAVFPTTFEELLVIAAGQPATLAEDRARQPPS